MLIGHMLRFLPAQLLAPVAQLASVVLWTHWLAPAQLGVFTLVSVAQEMAYAVGLSWFSIYALRYVPTGDGPALRRFLGTENTVVLGSVAAALLLGVATAATLPQGLDGSVPAGLAGGAPALLRDGLVIGLFFATRALNAHYAERARAQAAFLAYTLLQVCGPVGAIVLGLLALQRFEANAGVLLLAYAAAQALGALLALPLLRMHWRLARPDAATLRAALAFGAPVLGLGVLGWVAENHIRYLVQWQAGAATLGLMIVGWSLGRRCAAVAAMLVATAAFPLASRLLNEGRRDEALWQLRRNAALVLAVLAPVTTALALLGPALVALVVAPTYREATAALLGWAVLGGALRNLHVHVTDQLMVLERRLGLLAVVSTVEIAACAAAALAGLRLAGLPGALAGQAAGSALALALSVLWARQRLGLRWPWAASLRILLATAAMAAVLAWPGRAALAAWQAQLAQMAHAPSTGWQLLASLAAWPALPTLAALVAVAVLAAASYALALALLFAGQTRQVWRSARRPAANTPALPQPAVKL